MFLDLFHNYKRRMSNKICRVGQSDHDVRECVLEEFARQKYNVHKLAGKLETA